MHNQRLGDVFVAFEQSLIRDLKDNGPDGDIVEFGIYQGFMLGKLLEQAEAIGLKRTFYGFDSFEGLSEPSQDADYDSWQKGQYAAGYDLVAKNLRLSERPHLKLVKGWVEDSLKTPEAQAIRQIAYARIDVDIYDPTVDCLNYLSGRMADEAFSFSTIGPIRQRKAKAGPSSSGLPGRRNTDLNGWVSAVHVSISGSFSADEDPMSALARGFAECIDGLRNWRMSHVFGIAELRRRFSRSTPRADVADLVDGAHRDHACIRLDRALA